MVLRASECSTELGVVPLSNGAGEDASRGDRVTRVKEAERA